MNERERQPVTPSRPSTEMPPETHVPEESYPSVIESLSGKWRTIQPSEQAPKAGTFTQRNATILGIGIGLAVVILLAVVGGFLLLVWTVNR